MAVPRPTYKASLRLTADIGGDHASLFFGYFSSGILEWQRRQYDSWRAGEQRPLERWMREYIASQWTEFLEAVEWSVPSLVEKVAARQRELQQRQTERAVAIRRLQHARGLPLTSCGPVIAVLGRDIELDADEGVRSTLDTMRLVYHYTHEDGVPEWLDGVCVQREKRRRMTAPLEWKRSYGELATSESDDAMSQDGGSSSVGNSEETWSDTSSIVYGDEARARRDAAILEDMETCALSEAEKHAVCDCASPSYSDVSDDIDVAPRQSQWNCCSPTYSEVPEDFVVPSMELKGPASCA